MLGLRALDVDDRGRLLVSAAGGGRTRLVEVDVKGATELFSAPGPVVGRYLPGERKVVAQHGDPARLELLRVGGKPASLVGSGDHATELLGVLPGRVVYRANPRHRLLFEVVIRNVLVGEEQAVYDRGGDVVEAAVSPNSRHVAIRLPRKLILVDTMPVTEDDHVRLICPEPADGGHRELRWLPDSTRLVATEHSAQGATVACYDVGKQEWRPLVTSLPPAASAAAAPDGRRIAVVDGHRISLHHTDTGRFLRAAELPGPVVGGAVWSPDSRSVAAGLSDSVAVVAADSAAVRTVHPN